MIGVARGLDPAGGATLNPCRAWSGNLVIGSG